MADDVAPSPMAGEPLWTPSSSVVPALIGLAAIAIYAGVPVAPGTANALLVCGLGLFVLAGALAMLRRPVLDPRDYYGGLALFGVSLFLLWASSDLPGMRGFAFGPGTAPRIFASILGGLSLLVMVVGLFSRGPNLERYDISAPVLLIAAILLWAFSRGPELKIVGGVCLVAALVLGARGLLSGNRAAMRGPLFITLGTLFFALSIRQLGLVIASYITIITVAAGSSEVRWLETLAWAAVLTGFCVLVFPIALSLPLQMWPHPNLSLSTILNFR